MVKAKAKVVSEVVIDETRCFGCGYCEKFCPSDCFAIKGDKYNDHGQLLPTIVKPEECVGCGMCVWMCPHLALEVYQSSAT